jgi:hypothetical protein
VVKVLSVGIIGIGSGMADVQTEPLTQNFSDQWGGLYQNEFVQQPLALRLVG